MGGGRSWGSARSGVVRSRGTRKKPSRQRMRGSSSRPARLEGSEESWTLVTETKARELLMLGNGGLATQISPARVIEPGGLFDQLLPPGSILLPPFVVHHRTPVAQQIGVPVLATTDAAIQCLDAANAALHVVVGAGKVLAVRPPHPVGALVGEHLPELPDDLT